MWVVPEIFFAHSGEFRIFDTATFKVRSFDETLGIKGAHSGCIELAECFAALFVENPKYLFLSFRVLIASNHRGYKTERCF